MNNYNRNVTIIMYHYIRDIKNSNFKKIKGLETELFVEQLKYFKKYYKFIKMEDFIGFLDEGVDIPNNSLILTFDDGYIDHFENVFPILKKLGLQGSFYPIVRSVIEHKLLDVNKIHYILAAEDDIDKIIRDIFDSMDCYRKNYKIEENDDYYKKYAKKSRYDDEKTIFIKKMLQMGLEKKIRNEISSKLFEKYVNVSEEEFSKKIYVNLEQLINMREHGMHIGAHGYEHDWLDIMSNHEQEEQIDKSILFLNQIGIDISNWTMCYPYGKYNNETLKILRERKCKLALTTTVDIASNKYDRLEIPRLDTNDFPKCENELESFWVKKILVWK